MISATIPQGESARLEALESLDVLDTPPEERFDRVTRLTRRLFGVPLAYVSLIDRDRQWVKAQDGFSVPTEIPRSESFCAHAILDDSGVVVPDLLDDRRFCDSAFVTEAPFLRFYASVPLGGPDGHRVGTLCIADVQPREFSPADVALLRDLSAWVSREMNVQSELERAAEVQRAMLPQEPPHAPGWDIVGACVPSREVGGDFFDWYRARHGTVVTVGDVMGKGMPAAIVMASVRSALRAGGRLPDLAAGVRAAAESLDEDLVATSSFATALVTRFEHDGVVRAVDAGHGHALVLRTTGRSEPLTDIGGLPLGIAQDERYESDFRQLERGDIVVIHSDGLIELPGGPTGTADLAAILAGAAGASEVLDRLVALIGAAAPPDDVTIVVAQRTA